MKKKPEPAPKRAAEKPFFRPFEAVAKDLEKRSADKKVDAKKPAALPKPPPKPEPKGQAGREPTFAELMYGVQKIDRGPLRSPVPEVKSPPGFEEEAARRAREEEAAVREHLRKLVEGGDSRFEIHDDGRRVEGRRIDVDPKIVRRLRRGELTIDASCDLHGLAAHEARAKVEELVQKAKSRGERVVLVVHGKGTHSPRGVPILRGEMAAWLSEGPASVHVAAFTTALPDDGGDGAMYVLLR